MANSPLERLLNGGTQKITNPYDDGTLWSAKPTAGPSTSLFGDMGTFQGVKTSPFGAPEAEVLEDTLEYPRSQINYYTNKINDAGLDIPEPDALKKKESFGSKVFGKTMDVLQVTGTPINAAAGALNELVDTLGNKDKQDGFLKDAIDVIGAGLKSGLATFAAPINSDLREHRVDLSNLMDTMRESENGGVQFVSTFVETVNPVYAIARLAGKDNEDARKISGTITSMALDMAISAKLDIDGIGNALKHINRADDLKAISKITKADGIVDNAIDVIAEGKGKSIEKLIQRITKGNEITPEETFEIYETIKKGYGKQAEALVKRVNKKLGGTPLDYKGITIGNKTLISTAQLEKLGSTKSGKILSNIVGGYMSPVGLGWSFLSGRTAEQLSKGNVLFKGFSGGDNQNFYKDAYEALQKQDSTAVLKAFNGMQDLKVIRNIKNFSDSIVHKNATELQKMFNESGASMKSIMDAIETHGSEQFVREMVTEQKINPAYINAAREARRRIVKNLRQEVYSKKGKYESIANEDFIDALGKYKADIDAMPDEELIAMADNLRDFAPDGTSVEDMITEIKNNPIDNIVPEVEPTVQSVAEPQVQVERLSRKKREEILKVTEKHTGAVKSIQLSSNKEEAIKELEGINRELKKIGYSASDIQTVDGIGTNYIRIYKNTDSNIDNEKIKEILLTEEPTTAVPTPLSALAPEPEQTPLHRLTEGDNFLRTKDISPAERPLKNIAPTPKLDLDGWADEDIELPNIDIDPSTGKFIDKMDDLAVSNKDYLPQPTHMDNIDYRDAEWKVDDIGVRTTKISQKDVDDIIRQYEDLGIPLSDAQINRIKNLEIIDSRGAKVVEGMEKRYVDQIKTEKDILSWKRKNRAKSLRKAYDMSDNMTAMNNAAKRKPLFTSADTSKEYDFDDMNEAYMVIEKALNIRKMVQSRWSNKLKEFFGDNAEKLLKKEGLNDKNDRDIWSLYQRYMKSWEDKLPPAARSYIEKNEAAILDSWRYLDERELGVIKSHASNYKSKYVPTDDNMYESKRIIDKMVDDYEFEMAEQGAKNDIKGEERLKYTGQFFFSELEELPDKQYIPDIDTTRDSAKKSYDGDNLRAMNDEIWEDETKSKTKKENFQKAYKTVHDNVKKIRRWEREGVGYQSSGSLRFAKFVDSVEKIEANNIKYNKALHNKAQAALYEDIRRGTVDPYDIKSLYNKRNEIAKRVDGITKNISKVYGLVPELTEAFDNEGLDGVLKIISKGDVNMINPRDSLSLKSVQEEFDKYITQEARKGNLALRRKITEVMEVPVNRNPITSRDELRESMLEAFDEDEVDELLGMLDEDYDRIGTDYYDWDAFNYTSMDSDLEKKKWKDPNHKVSDEKLKQQRLEAEAKETAEYEEYKRLLREKKPIPPELRAKFVKDTAEETEIKPVNNKKFVGHEESDNKFNELLKKDYGEPEATILPRQKDVPNNSPFTAVQGDSIRGQNPIGKTYQKITGEKLPQSPIEIQKGRELADQDIFGDSPKKLKDEYDTAVKDRDFLQSEYDRVQRELDTLGEGVDDFTAKGNDIGGNARLAEIRKAQLLDERSNLLRQLGSANELVDDLEPRAKAGLQGSPFKEADEVIDEVLPDTPPAPLDTPKAELTDAQKQAKLDLEELGGVGDAREKIKLRAELDRLKTQRASITDPAERARLNNEIAKVRLNLAYREKKAVRTPLEKATEKVEKKKKVLQELADEVDTSTDPAVLTAKKNEMTPEEINEHYEELKRITPDESYAAMREARDIKLTELNEERAKLQKNLDYFEMQQDIAVQTNNSKAFDKWTNMIGNIEPKLEDVNKQIRSAMTIDNTPISKAERLTQYQNVVKVIEDAKLDYEAAKTKLDDLLERELTVQDVLDWVSSEGIELDPEKFEEVQTLMTRTIKKDAIGELSEDEKKIADLLTKLYKEMGVSEGIIDVNDMREYFGYIPHIMNKDLEPEVVEKMAQKLGFSVDKPFSVHHMSREMSGTVTELNKLIKHKYGVEDWFETNVIRQYINRSMSSNNYIAKRDIDEAFEQFKEHIISPKRFRDLSTEDMRIELERLGGDISDPEMPLGFGRNHNGDLVSFVDPAEKAKYPEAPGTISTMVGYVDGDKTGNVPFSQRNTVPRAQALVRQAYTDRYYKIWNDITKGKHERYVYVRLDEEEIKETYVALKKNLMIEDPRDAFKPPAEEAFDPANEETSGIIRNYIEQGKTSEDFANAAYEGMLHEGNKRPVLTAFPEDLEIVNIDEKAIKGYFLLPRNIAKQYETVIANMTKNKAGRFTNFYNKAMNVFKAWAVTSPGFHVNNIIGNQFNTALQVGMDAFNPKVQKESFNLLKEAAAVDFDWTRMTGDLYGTPKSEIVQAIVENGLLSGFFNTDVKAVTEMAAGNKKSIEELKGIKKFLKQVNPFDAENNVITNKNKEFGELLERQGKVSNMIAHMKQGRSVYEAVDMAQEALFDYADLTTFESEVVKKYIAPFYTFAKKNFGYQAENLANNPAMYTMIERFYRYIDKNFTTEKERMTRPDYISGGIKVGDGKYLDLPTPLNSFTDVFNPQDLYGMVNPFAKSAVDFAYNTKSYTGGKISKTNNPLEKLEYVIKSTLPFLQTGDTVAGIASEDPARREKAMRWATGNRLRVYDQEDAEQRTAYDYMEQLQHYWYDALRADPNYKLKAEEIAELRNGTKSKKLTPLQSLLRKE